MLPSQNITKTHLEQAKQGIEDAVVFILDCLRPALAALVRGMKVPVQEMDDILQDSVLCVICCIDSFDFGLSTSFPEYAISTVRNMLVDRWRWLSMTPTVGLSFEPVVLASDFNEPVALLKETLSQLPNQQRELLVEHYGVNGPGYSLGQLATRYNTSTAYVKRQLTEAFEVLRNS